MSDMTRQSPAAPAAAYLHTENQQQQARDYSQFLMYACWRRLLFYSVSYPSLCLSISLSLCLSFSLTRAHLPLAGCSPADFELQGQAIQLASMDHGVPSHGPGLAGESRELGAHL